MTCEDVGWTHLAQGTVQWWGIVNMAMDIPVS